MNSPFDQKLARIFADVTDNGSSDADPEIMAMHVSKLCRFVTLIGGREVPEIRAELDRFSELLPYYSMLEALRVTVRRLLPDTSHTEANLLGPLASSRKEAVTGSLTSLTVNYTVSQPPGHDVSVLPAIFQQTYSIIREQMNPRPVNVLLLLDYAVRRGRELGLDTRDDDGDPGALDEDRNLLRFFQSVTDEEDDDTPPPTDGDLTPPRKPTDSDSDAGPGVPF